MGDIANRPTRRTAQLCKASVGLVLIALCAAVQTPAWAADTRALIREFDRTVREAEVKLRARDYEAATEKLGKAKELIEQFKAADPRSRRGKSMQSKVDRVQKQLDLRMGKATPATQPTRKPAGPAKRAAAGAKLPGGVTHRLKKIEKILDGKGRGDPFKIMEEIEKRYGAEIPAGHPQIKSVKDRLAALKAENEAAAEAKADAAATAAQAAAQKEAMSKEWVAKLEPYVDYKSPKYLINGTEKYRAEEAQRKQRPVSYREASTWLAEYRKTDFPSGKTDYLLDVVRRLEPRLKDYETDQGTAAVEAGSAQWLARLNTFVKRYDSVNNRPNPKCLAAVATQDVNELRRLRKLYDEASAVFAEYRKAEFPKGKSSELKQAEDALASTLEEFPKAFDQNLGRMFDTPEAELKRWTEYLAKRTAWRTDRKEMPDFIMERDLDAVRKGIARLAALVPADHPRLAALNRGLAALVMENEARRQARAERTYMLPDRFKGKGKAAIKAKAQELVRKAAPAARALRTTVISADWKEESGWEWTDTTKTKRRFRTTRSVTAQVAAKAEGRVLLYTVYVAKDRRTDNTWGALYGNLHQTADRMAEANVHKTGP